MPPNGLQRFLLSGLVLVAGLAQAAPRALPIDDELAGLIGEREVVFLARDLGTGTERAFSPERLTERHAPFSTFKIPNFLIALASGAVADEHAEREWDASARPAEAFWPRSWQGPQSLVSAFRRSAVWFFRDVAVTVGGARYRAELARLAYGNGAAPDGNDGFWLDGSLRVSVREQVDFLDGLVAGRYGFDTAHMDALREASRLAVDGECRLHGKTGAGPAGDDFDGPFEGWLVGWAQCGEAAPTVYALWTRGESFAAIRDFRRRAAEALLRRAGAPGPWRSQP
jgi:beta-lactamase class D